jgi:hypothetical protein
MRQFPQIYRIAFVRMLARQPATTRTGSARCLSAAANPGRKDDAPLENLVMDHTLANDL